MNVIGTVGGYCRVQSLRTQEQFLTSSVHLKYIPHEWKNAAMLYEPQRLMSSFDAPGDVENWTSYNPRIQTEHPSYSSVRAFWGNNAFNYMFEASKQHTYGRSRGKRQSNWANDEFWKLNSRVFGGVVWSNCCLLYTSPSPRDVEESRMPSSA